MTVHQKIGGTWTNLTGRAYVRHGGKWKPVKEIWSKHSGEWKRAWEYDITPPDPPVTSLELVETEYFESGELRTGRHIKVGVRTPGLAHDEDLKWIRVLTNQADDSPPSTQFGATHLNGRAEEYPNEPWSDFSFNGTWESRDGKDSSEFHYKKYPRNAGRDSQLESKTYYFTAWSLDDAGNWSVSTPASIFVPKKSVDAAEVRVKEVRFQAINAGSLDTDDEFTAGELRQEGSPLHRGVWTYGEQIKVVVGEQGPATIRSASIYIHRRNDTGPASANIWLFWHTYGSVGTFAEPFERNNITKVGVLNKGESKWFPLPEAMRTAIEDNNLRGFGLNHKDPAASRATASDFSVVRGLDETIRSGEVHITWTERL